MTNYRVQMRKTNGAPYGMTVTAESWEDAEIKAQRYARAADHDFVRVIRTADEPGRDTL